MPAPLHIMLPEPLRDWLQRQVSRNGYETASDYVLDLLRHEQLREIRDRVDAKLVDALDSGPATEMTERDWQDIRDPGRRSVAKKRKRA